MIHAKCHNKLQGIFQEDRYPKRSGKSSIPESVKSRILFDEYNRRKASLSNSASGSDGSYQLFIYCILVIA